MNKAPELEVSNEKEIVAAYYQNRDAIITEKYLSGSNEEDIIKQTGFSAKIVRAVILRHGLEEAKEKRDKKLAQEVLKEKIPVLQAITRLSLNAVKDWLEETVEDAALKAVRIANVRDVRALTSIAKELNEMLRLELGESTQNVKHDVEFSIDQTKKVLREIKSVDPIFDYPEIEDAEIIE